MLQHHASRTIPFLAATLAALALAACGGPAVPLTGTITDAYSGQPVAAAQLALGDTTLAVDPSGAYRIERWSTSDTLAVNAAGYEALSVPLEGKADLAQPTPPAATLNVTIRPNTLSGIVADSTGKPVAGALVQASDTISATTAADGRYTLNGLPEQFSVTIAAPDHEPITQQVARTTALDAALRPNVLTGLVANRLTGDPVAGATITLGERTATTGADGRYRLTKTPVSGTVEISAPGFANLAQQLGSALVLDAELRPDVFAGTLIDAATTQPIINATIIATPSLGAPDVAFSRIDNQTDGAFSLAGFPETGFVQVLAPGYRKLTLPIAAGMPTKLALEPFFTRALYVTAAVASNTDLFTEYLDLIDTTELNAIVIDLKSDLRDDLGLVYYDSQVPLVKELELSRPYMDIQAILDETKRRGIYTIARIHIFSHDNVLADARPEWAAKDRSTGEVFADYPGPGIRYAWLDPWNRNVWDYNIQLSVEAAQLGFDEVQFDYIRFPSLEFDPTDAERLQLSREGTAEERAENIGEMLKLSQRAINGHGAFLSVDTFGYTAFRPAKLIGQNLQIMGKYTDYVSPMVYPSHYSPGDLGFDNPSEHPYEVIRQSMEAGQGQLAGVRAKMRPWLQDFTLTWVPKDQIVVYGAAEVEAQIRAAEEAGGVVAGWMLYDSANTYTEEALKPE